MRLFSPRLPAHATALRLLVLAISERCDQRCVHCQIWMGPPSGRSRSLTLEERRRVVDDAIEAGVERVLLTGGEPLLSPDLWPLAERLRAASVKVLLATNGLLLASCAEQAARLLDEVYVSLDGATPASHDALRGVPSFERVAAGIAALRARDKRPLLVARSTLHARNIHEFEEIVEAARRVGFDHVSFLPIDASSEAFGGRAGERAPLLPSEPQLLAFLAALSRLKARGALRDGFVLEPERKLRRLAAHLRASGGRGAFERPECDAPWWSSVVEADGALRPCFFHGVVGDARMGLQSVRRSSAYERSLALVRATNATCERCVCPKRRGVPLQERLRA
jgi:MoaA/NifB/PqqE/SkfB family radical SAM enzyme